jgi:NAD(P)-dependent dehydrogenase (short-subunit alcohol dehydrogenase family)
MPDLRFDDRVAVVTGAGRGLGRAYALLLASNGAKVVVNDIGAKTSGEGVDAGPAEQVVEEIRAGGGDAVACLESVATPEGGEAIIRTALDRWGRIDVLIPNAGNLRYGFMREIPREDFEAVVGVHLWGAYNLVRPAFPLMCEAGYGRIVLISSISGLYGNVRCANYAVSKTGMVGFCNVLALEGADHGVKCNVMAPGSITRMAAAWDTSQYPSTMAPENVAPAVGWLAHESCSITGEILTSIAGRVARMFLAETQGVFRETWTMEEIGRQIEAIRDANHPLAFAPVPAGLAEHVGYSFDMARRGTGQGARGAEAPA